MPYLTSRMKGSLPCRCDRGERQRLEDEYAALMGRAPKKVSHNPSCPIVQAARLKQIEVKLARQDEQPTLPDPVLEAIESQATADLRAERDRLRRKLAPHIETGVVSTP